MLECQGESNAVRTACSQPEDGRGPAPLGSSTAQHARTGRSRPRLHSSPLRRSSSRREPTRASSSRRRRKRGPTSNPTSLGAACERPPPYSPPTRTHLRPYDNESRDLSGRGVLLLLLLLPSERAAGAGVCVGPREGWWWIGSEHQNQIRGAGGGNAQRHAGELGRKLTLISLLSCSSTVRKSIARVLTVINHKTRANLRELYKGKKLPLDMRAKKTRAIRRRLTKVRRPAGAVSSSGGSFVMLTLFPVFLFPAARAHPDHRACAQEGDPLPEEAVHRQGLVVSLLSPCGSRPGRNPLTSCPFSIALVLTRVA
jgi:hypothetical protein